MILPSGAPPFRTPPAVPTFGAPGEPRLRRVLTTSLLVFAVLFLAPAVAALGWWSTVDRPASWSSASWGSAGTLPAAGAVEGPVVHVMTARTGGLKGALALHSWIVTKADGAGRYTRYDKVGWGSPVRRNAYAADAYWYSNPPVILTTLTGERAASAIRGIERAVETYPFRNRGGYRIWPGPNSNSFVAHVLREVPELDVNLPEIAVGRDYPTDGRLVAWDGVRRDLRVSLWGFAGLSVGATAGLELNVLGLVAGLDPLRPAIKLPGFGRIGMDAVPRVDAVEIEAA